MIWRDTLSKSLKFRDCSPITLRPLFKASQLNIIPFLTRARDGLSPSWATLRPVHLVLVNSCIQLGDPKESVRQVLWTNKSKSNVCTTKNILMQSKWVHSYSNSMLKPINFGLTSQEWFGNLKDVQALSCSDDQAEDCPNTELLSPCQCLRSTTGLTSMKFP